MFETIRNAWKIEDLRKKILFTLMIIFVFRIGSAIPVPFMIPENLISMQGAGLFEYFDMLTGGAFSQATLFAMSISPYITASIIIQLLQVAIPALERMAKEGEGGQKKIAKISRYTTLGLALLQSTAYFLMHRASGAVRYYGQGFQDALVAVVVILSFTAGAMLIVWLGESIDKKGIGNGISMILFAGIISRGPSTFMTLFVLIRDYAIKLAQYQYFFYVFAILVIFLAMIALIVLMTNAERRIPIQYSKRVVGRKMYGGQSSYIPVKVMMSGVMPIIFAGAILSIPSMIKTFARLNPEGMGYKILSWFDNTSPVYAVLYLLLIIAFNYFYVAIQYNPVQMANDLRKNNGAIPGIRPGKPTSDFIAKVISKITLVGALFVAFVAILPILLNLVMPEIANINLALGGTSIIIVVGVALDTVRALESQMMMRHYKGFLE